MSPKSLNGLGVLALASLSLAMLLLAPHTDAASGTYQDNRKLLNTLLASDRYNKNIRPLLNQSENLQVMSYFELISITEVDDIHQTFVANGFLFLWWVDELLRWNPEDHGGVKTITPVRTDLFRPHLFLLNAKEMRERDKQDSDLVVHSSGLVQWSQSVVYKTSCQLDLTKFPFDEQSCRVELVDLLYTPKEISFITQREGIYNSFFVESGQWDVLDPEMSTDVMELQGVEYATIQMTFHLERKPVFLVLTILLPIILISLLNILVFIIPVSSGNKVGYGTTVLLSLMVYLSVMSSNLPRSSKPMPIIIGYILTLLIISMLSVFDAIIIVTIHRKAQKEEKRIQALKENNDSEAQAPMLEKPVFRIKSAQAESRSLVNKYRTIVKYIDRVSLVIFGVVWLIVNIAFISAMAS